MGIGDIDGLVCVLDVWWCELLSLCEWPFVHVTVWHGMWLDWFVCWSHVCMIVMDMLYVNVLVCVHCDSMCVCVCVDDGCGRDGCV